MKRYLGSDLKACFVGVPAESLKSIQKYSINELLALKHLVTVIMIFPRSGIEIGIATYMCSYYYYR